MASAIRIELWTDLVPSASTAHDVAEAAAAQLRRSGPAHAAAVAAVEVVAVEPGDITNPPAPAPKAKKASR